jgi:hypothetical protein
MTTELSDYRTGCINGCTRKNADGNREATPAKHGHLCSGCYDRLEKWLTEIPERFALLPEFLTQGTQLEPNPGSKATKRTMAPAPLRVGALDLLDTRRGRKWLGTEPTDDRRGAIGALLAIANEIRVLRGSPIKNDSHVLGEADYIRLSLGTLATQEWVTESYKEIKTLHRELGDAVGIYPPRPVATCTVVDPNTDDPHPCDGPLYPSKAGGVYCARCNSTWDTSDLRRLGLTLGASA